jgi:hypothetical protein
MHCHIWTPILKLKCRQQIAKMEMAQAFSNEKNGHCTLSHESEANQKLPKIG